MHKAFVVLICRITLTARLVTIKTTRWQYFYFSKILLPLQRCHLTYIPLTGRNGQDKNVNCANPIWPAYLFIGPEEEMHF